MYNEEESFQIRIPKEFIKDGHPDKHKLDFVLWFTVHYFFNSQNEMVLSVDMLFELGEIFEWSNNRFKQYLMAACKNQWDNNHPEGIANPNFAECLN